MTHISTINDDAAAYADRYDDGNRTPRQLAIMAYAAGATRSNKSSLWHPVSDTPEPGRTVIVLTGARQRLAQTTPHTPEQWLTAIAHYRPSRWAYKEDLV